MRKKKEGGASRASSRPRQKKKVQKEALDVDVWKGAAAFPRAVLGAEEEKEKRGGERRLKREWVVMDPIRAMERPGPINSLETLRAKTLPSVQTSLVKMVDCETCGADTCRPRDMAFRVVLAPRAGHRRGWCLSWPFGLLPAGARIRPSNPLFISSISKIFKKLHRLRYCTKLTPSTILILMVLN